MKQIFPKEIIESTVDAHQFEHSTRSKVIYSTILMALIIALGLLPFITVDIYTSARGIITPDKERLSVTSLSSGHIVKTFINNNKKVSKGDTLLVLDNETLSEKIKLSSKQISNINLYIKDLTYLINNKKQQLNKVESPKYKKELILYKQNQNELQTRFRKLKQDFERNKKLYEKGVIAKIEYENVKFDYDLILSSIYQLKQQQINTWQSILTEHENNLLEFNSNDKQLLEDQSHYVVIAPITGTLLNVKSVAEGSLVKSGEALAYISPDTNLIVECLINPIDIGLLKSNMESKFQIDAYNYNQWGLATGNITSISKDIEFINEQSVFKVQCQLNENVLQLKNGFEGKLKKGMTLNAQFKLTERTLFDLLYDKLDNWVNPSQNNVAVNN